MFPEIAEQQKVTLIPFLLEDVGGMPSMNLPDGIHPNLEGHRRVAETVWTYLKPLL
jgi:acyl-CoA thioesterase-1